MRLAQREQAIGRAEGPTAPRRWLRCPDGLSLSLILYLYLYLTPPPLLLSPSMLPTRRRPWERAATPMPGGGGEGPAPAPVLLAPRRPLLDNPRS